MSTAQQPTSTRVWAVAYRAIKDVGLTGLALWGIWHQEHTGHVQPWLLLTYVVVLGLIPASHALALLRLPAGPESPDTTRTPDTALSPR